MLTPSTLLSGPIITIRRLCLRKLQPYMSKELWYLCADNEPVLVFLLCRLAKGTVIYFIIYLEIHIDDGIVWPIFARHHYGITNIWALCRPCMASIFPNTKCRRINHSSDVYVYIWNKKKTTNHSFYVLSFQSLQLHINSDDANDWLVFTRLMKYHLSLTA